MWKYLVLSSTNHRIGSCVLRGHSEDYKVRIETRKPLVKEDCKSSKTFFSSSCSLLWSNLRCIVLICDKSCQKSSIQAIFARRRRYIKTSFPFSVSLFLARHDVLSMTVDNGVNRHSSGLFCLSRSNSVTLPISWDDPSAVSNSSSLTSSDFVVVFLFAGLHRHQHSKRVCILFDVISAWCQFFRFHCR